MNVSTPRPASDEPEVGRTAHSWLYRFALLLLCGAYLQGGIDKLWDFPGALAEMAHFGLTPAAPIAILVICLELGASLLIVAGNAGNGRWLAALALAAYTLAATLVANRFWQAPVGERVMSANAFFEHLGLVGGFIIVAWNDLHTPRNWSRS